jgi:hypothetical protein
MHAQPSSIYTYPTVQPICVAVQNAAEAGAQPFSDEPIAVIIIVTITIVVHTLNCLSNVCAATSTRPRAKRRPPGHKHSIGNVSLTCIRPLRAQTQRCFACAHACSRRQLPAVLSRSSSLGTAGRSRISPAQPGSWPLLQSAMRNLPASMVLAESRQVR